MSLSTSIFIIVFIFVAGIFSFIAKKIYKHISVPKIKKINDLIEEKKYDIAIKKLKDLLNNLKDESYKSKVHELLGDCYYSIGDYSFAVVEYKKSISDGFEDNKRLLSLARSLFKIGRNEEALAQYMSILKRDLNNIDVYIEIGIIYYNNLQYEIADNYFDKAIGIDPRNIKALKYKGICAVNMGKYDEAIGNLTMAVRKDSKDSLVHYSLARAYKGRKDYQNALLQYKVASKDPVYAIKSLYESALCYIAIGDMGNAINDLESVAKIDNRDKELSLNILYTLGDCYEKTRNINKAIEVWEHIIIIDYNFRDVNDKLNEYKDSRYSDNIKNFFNSDKEELVNKSLKLVSAMTLTPYSLKVNDMGYIIIFAKDGLGVHAPTRIIYIRSSCTPVFNDELMKLFEYSKSVNILRSILVTCAMVSPDAIRYAAMYHIDIVGVKKLDELIQKSLMMSVPGGITRSEEILKW